MLEQQAQRRGCLAMASQYETAGGVAVEPMGENRRCGQTRTAARRRRIPDWHRPWDRDAPAAPRACRSPASARRDGARGPEFHRRSARELPAIGRDFRLKDETANTPPT